MTKSKVFEILDNILLDNDFWLSEIDECREKNAELIENINSIFKLEKPMDFTLLLAAIELLCKSPEPVMDYFLKNNKTQFPIVKPRRNDLLIITTVFRGNPIFFSKCWNLVALIEHELAEEAQNKNNENILHIDFKSYQTVVLNRSILVPAAGTKKTNNITTLTVDPIGELQILGNDYLGFITFAIFLKPEYQKLMFRVVIKYEIDNKEYFAEIKKDTISEQKTISPEKPEYVDFSKGVRIKSIEWSPME